MTPEKNFATVEARVAEYATSLANQIADGFDRAHQPEVDDGQLALDVDTDLILGDSERIRVDRALAVHTARWLDVNAANHARVSAAWAAKDQHGRKLLAIQSETGCSMWEAEQILRNGAA